MQRVLKVGVIGGGSFGTALGSVAARCGHNVKIYSRNERVISEINSQRKNSMYFSDEITLPHNLKATNKLEEVFDKPDMIIHAIPVQASYDFIKANADKIPENTPYVMASKGILIKQKKFFSEVWNEIFPNKRVPHCIISGPSFAIEIMREYPTVVSLGCKDKVVAKFVQQNLSIESFRTYTTQDVLGVEIGGALKNPLAIAAGIIEGKGFKYNTVAALVTRGMYEISLFSEKFGGKSETLYGLSGIGDVMLTCMGTLSRNKSVGFKLAQGMTLDEIMRTNVEVAEGIPTLQVVGDLIKEHNLNMPIMNTLYKFATGEITSTEEVLRLIMLRQLEEETELKI